MRDQNDNIATIRNRIIPRSSRQGLTLSMNSTLALMVAYLYGVPLVDYALSIQLAVLLLSGCFILITHKYVLSTKKLTYFTVASHGLEKEKI